MQASNSPPCSFPHRQSLWCSTAPGASSGAGRDTLTPSHPPAGSQTRGAGDSLCCSAEETYRCVVKNAILRHIKPQQLQKNLPCCGHDRPGRRRETPGLHHHWSGQCNHRVWPPDRTRGGLHTGLVVYSKISTCSSWREPKYFHPLRTSLAPIFSSTIKKLAFKVKADHRAKEAGLDWKPKVTLKTFGLKRSWKY